jgi:acyl-CoA synthetase (AMP-forming)/AMP-acid ligase II
MNEELVYQLQTAQSKLIITHPAVLNTVLSAARSVGLPTDRIVLLESSADSATHIHFTLDHLIAEGLSKEPHFVEKRLAPGEAKTKVAFLSLSSGTTGKPKVCMHTPIFGPGLSNLLSGRCHPALCSHCQHHPDGCASQGQISARGCCFRWYVYKPINLTVFR